jgi:GntR family transcriptional regulator/MocR family aminotransferase
LPSTRTLASELGLSRTTLRQSFEQLTDEGCLDGRVGRGSFVPYELAHDRLRKVMPRHGQPATHKDPLARLSHRGKKIVGAKVYGGTAARPFDPGLPALDLFPAALWARVAARRWRRLENATMGYGQAGGYPPLRQALAAYLTSTRGLQCDERQIIITAGILQSLTLLSQLLLDPNDFVWVESPGIISGHAVFRAAGARLVPVHCDSAGLSVAEGRRKRADAKLVYLCPSRHYPLGRTMPLHRRLELLAWSKDAGSWILENDYDSEFRYRGHPLPALQGLDGGGSVIYLGSFSKTLFPGLRVGYLVVPPELADPLAAAQQSVMPVPTPVQAIIADFIDGGHYSNHIRLMRQAYGQREAALAEAIGAQASGLLQPEPTNSGFHFLAHLADHIDGDLPA